MGRFCRKCGEMFEPTGRFSKICETCRYKSLLLGHAAASVRIGTNRILKNNAGVSNE